MKIALDELRQKMVATLTKNLSQEDAETVAEVLLWADMSGVRPMGIAKMIGSEPVQDQKATAPVEVIRNTKLSRLISAHGAPAPLVSRQATDVAIQKAKEHGFGMVGVNGTFTSSCALSYYVDRIAEQGLIGIVMSRAGGSMAPFGSADPLFGTNPMAYGFPTADEPVVFDMTTSSMTWTGLVLAKAHGERLPEGVAIDKHGNPTTDPAEALEGAMFPFDGGYKGSGLSMLVEIMSGPLVSSAYCDYQTTQDYGGIFIAIDPELLVDTEKFKAEMSDMVKKIKSSRKQKDVDEIRLPGERARAMREEAQKTGMVEVDEMVLRQLGYIE